MIALAITRIAAQSPAGRSVTDGVYTEAQATRGGLSYETACSNCHRGDLGGGTGPALKEDRFARDYAGKDLKVLYTKIATTMPRDAGGTLGDDVYLDIVAHILRENGFPAGQKELTANDLDGVAVVPGKPKPPPPIGDFSYVQVVGCFTAGPRDTWLLTRASDPVVAVLKSTVESESAPPESVTPANMALGSRTFNLLDALAYAPATHKGQKVAVRGLLIRLKDEQRITISEMERVGECGRN